MHNKFYANCRFDHINDAPHECMFDTCVHRLWEMSGNMPLLCVFKIYFEKQLSLVLCTALNLPLLSCVSRFSRSI